MYQTSLRKVGGSTMLTVPPSVLNTMELGAGSRVDLAVDNGRLIVQPVTRPRYSLDELIAQCDPSAPTPAEDQAWLEDGPVGNELI